MADEQDALPTVDFAGVVRTVMADPETFLRYSAGPDADAREGPSRDFEADVELPGWSVTTVAAEPWWTRPVEDWIARRICKYAELGDEEGRRPWLLTGRVVGRGPDHEPLVVDIRPVAWIGDDAVAEAHRRYHQDFEVGQDSRK